MIVIILENIIIHGKTKQGRPYFFGDVRTWRERQALVDVNLYSAYLTNAMGSIANWNRLCPCIIYRVYATFLLRKPSFQLNGQIPDFEGTSSFPIDFNVSNSKDPLRLIRQTSFPITNKLWSKDRDSTLTSKFLCSPNCHCTKRKRWTKEEINVPIYNSPEVLIYCRQVGKVGGFVLLKFK